MFANHNPLAIDLLKKMLLFDPLKRITVNEALEHPFLENLHSEEDEPTADLVTPFDFDFEIYDLKKSEYTDLIYEEVMLYHSDEMLRLYLENKKKYPNGILNKRFATDKIKNQRRKESTQSND